MTGLRVDLRDVHPVQHASTLAEALRRLPAGGALELVSAVDPGVLRTQVNAVSPARLSWGDGTQADGAWRVRIVKDGADSCCGGCSGH